MLAKAPTQTSRSRRTHPRCAVRKPVEIRVELEAPTGWLTARTRDITADGLLVVCGFEFQVGDFANVLLYLPRRDDVDLVRVRSEVIWCRDRQGLFTIGTAFRQFAPGDERRLRRWLAGLELSRTGTDNT